MRSVRTTSHACNFQDLWKWKSARPTNSEKLAIIACSFSRKINCFHCFSQRNKIMNLRMQATFSGRSRPSDKGGGAVSKKIFFGPSGRKIRGAPPRAPPLDPPLTFFYAKEIYDTCTLPTSSKAIRGRQCGVDHIFKDLGWRRQKRL